MQKPKLLVVSDTYYPKVDGTLKFVEEFISRSKHDFSISLLVPKLKNIKHKLAHHTTFIKPSKLFSLSGYPCMGLTFSNLSKIKHAVKESDCVFVQGPALISFLSVLYAHRFKKKVIYYMHVLTWEVFAKFMMRGLQNISHWFLKRFSLAVLNRCNQVLVPYPGLAEQLKEQGVKSQMHVAKLGVDIKRFRPSQDREKYKKKFGIDPEKTVAGYVGRLSKEKNIDVLVSAFSKLHEQENLVLLLVGDGSKEQKKELNLPKNCIVTGFVDNVEEYLRAMDIFVMPSLTETTSLATLEAMATGLPVITSKIGYIKEYVVRNHNGIFFPKSSSTHLAMKIEYLRADKGRRALLGSNARKTVAYSFSWERSINRIKRLLMREVLSE